MSPTPPLSLSIISQTLLFTLLISFKSVSTTLEKTTPSLFIFGDSTVNVGNNYYINTEPGNRVNYPPYGQNGFFEKPTGRFSDGRVIVDFIAEYAKLPLIPPFKQPDTNFDKGVNFAAGGAGVLPETYQGLVIDLQMQLKQFDKVVESINVELGDRAAREVIAKSVFFISIGSNDYLSYLNNPKLQEVFTSEDMVGMVIGNLSEAIQYLYDKGGRKFGVLSVSPLGCMPALRAVNPKADGGCYEDLSELALAHNKAFSGVLLSFEYILKGFKYAFSSGFYSWLEEVLLNPSKFGFKDGTNACCGSGAYGGSYTCGINKEEGGYELCSTPEDFVWWDSYHGTEKTAKKIADALWDGPTEWVGPYSLKGLFSDHDESKVEDLVDNEETMSNLVDNEETMRVFSF